MRNWAQNLLCAKGRYGMIGALRGLLFRYYPSGEASHKFRETDNPAGYYRASKIRIIRAVKDAKGNARKLPWYIEIENGKGIPQKNSTGGTYMKANSFLSEGKAYTNLSDLDLFRLLSRVSSYIDSWEKAVAPSVNLS